MGTSRGYMTPFAAAKSSERRFDDSVEIDSGGDIFETANLLIVFRGDSLRTTHLACPRWFIPDRYHLMLTGMV